MELLDRAEAEWKQQRFEDEGCVACVTCGRPVVGLESEPDRAVRLTTDAGVEVYAASVAVGYLPQTERVAHASRLISDAYRSLEDAESLLRSWRAGDEL